MSESERELVRETVNLKSYNLFKVLNSEKVCLCRTREIEVGERERVRERERERDKNNNIFKFVVIVTCPITK